MKATISIGQIVIALMEIFITSDVIFMNSITYFCLGSKSCKILPEEDCMPKKLIQRKFVRGKLIF